MESFNYELKLNKVELWQKFEPVILHALQGDYQSANEMRMDLLQVMNKPLNDTKPVSPKQSVGSKSRHYSSNRIK